MEERAALPYGNMAAVGRPRGRLIGLPQVVFGKTFAKSAPRSLRVRRPFGTAFATTSLLSYPPFLTAGAGRALVPSGSSERRTSLAAITGRIPVMLARELVELAAIVSAHGPVLINGIEKLSATSIEQYWAESKCRLDRWGRSLKGFKDALADADPQQREAQWPSVRGVLEEILTGEVLTRVWTAVLCAHDRRHQRNELEPVARSVLIGHLEARHRVLTLLVRSPGIEAEAALKLNHLRRRTERWADMLVGYLVGLHDVSEFAINPGRARDFAEDLRYQSNLRGGRHAWPLVLASLRSAFRDGLCPVSPNAELNTKIASSILSCFQPELFDSTGLFRSLWMTRLSNVANDAQGMVDDLLALDSPTPGGVGEHLSTRLEDRLRGLGEETQ